MIYSINIPAIIIHFISGIVGSILMLITVRDLILDKKKIGSPWYKKINSTGSWLISLSSILIVANVSADFFQEEPTNSRSTTNNIMPQADPTLRICAGDSGIRVVRLNDVLDTLYLRICADNNNVFDIDFYFIIMIPDTDDEYGDYKLLKGKAFKNETLGVGKSLTGSLKIVWEGKRQNFLYVRTIGNYRGCSNNTLVPINDLFKYSYETNSAGLAQVNIKRALDSKLIGVDSVFKKFNETRVVDF